MPIGADNSLNADFFLFPLSWNADSIQFKPVFGQCERGLFVLIASYLKVSRIKWPINIHPSALSMHPGETIKKTEKDDQTLLFLVWKQTSRIDKAKPKKPVPACFFHKVSSSDESIPAFVSAAHCSLTPPDSSHLTSRLPFSYLDQHSLCWEEEEEEKGRLAWLLLE